MFKLFAPRGDASGFTLIELMIVVSIMGLLAAIAIPNFVRFSDNAREAKVKATCHTVQLAVENFSTQNDGVYPLTLLTVSNFGETTIDLLPGGALIANAWTEVQSEPRDGAPASSGQIGFAPIVVGGIITGYTVDGFGKAAVVLTVKNGA